MRHRFTQVDVFGSTPWTGNPVAVVHDADDLTTAQMAAFAHWTNLSETTFLLRPTDPEADYRLRIFTPAEELPFAGHPTLGSAYAWLLAGGSPRATGRLRQECGVGVVELRHTDRLAFAAPPLIRSGPPTDHERAVVQRALRVDATEIVGIEWIDNGPGWLGVHLASAHTVLALEPDWSQFSGIEMGVVGKYDPPGPGGALVEVRAFCPSLGAVEDPVTGSLNAGIAQWLTRTGAFPDSYLASQGTRVGRAGRVHVSTEGATIWIAGDCAAHVVGEVDFGPA